MAESKEIEEETEHLAADADNGEDLSLPFHFPPMMNIELIKVNTQTRSMKQELFCKQCDQIGRFILSYSRQIFI